MREKLSMLVGIALSAWVLGGCGPAYCQSGPKYGTQCYTGTGTGNPAFAPTGPSTPPQERTNWPQGSQR